MPQMAPIMWMPWFILITLLLLLKKSTTYFISNKNSIKVTPKNSYFSTNWLW